MALYNVDYGKIKSAGILIGLFIYLLSCSTDSNRYTDGNLLISFQITQEPLLSIINNASISVINSHDTIIFDTTFDINPYYNEPPQFDIQVQEEMDMIAWAWFFDDARRPFYRARQEVIRIENSAYFAVLNMTQSGYLSGTHVKILRDEPPWDSYGLDTVLTEIGFTVGTTGGNRFNICPSSDLRSLDLHPGRDLLIISNDQPQWFYNNLALNMENISEFARAGGTVLWETCDLAWNYGSYAAAGLDTLPGRITLRTAYDSVNIIADPDFGMVNGLGDTLRGLYASNKYLANVADSAIIYTENSAGNSTLIGLRFGEGLIFYSGQPLEYNFDRRDNYNMGFLLPRLIRFMLGISWEEPSLHLYGGVVDSRQRKDLVN